MERSGHHEDPILLSPMEDFTDDGDDMAGYKISTIEDEESHIYAKIGAPASFMMQRFQQKPFPSVALITIHCMHILVMAAQKLVR